MAPTGLILLALRFIARRPATTTVPHIEAQVCEGDADVAQGLVLTLVHAGYAITAHDDELGELVLLTESGEDHAVSIVEGEPMWDGQAFRPAQTQRHLNAFRDRQSSDRQGGRFDTPEEGHHGYDVWADIATSGWTTATEIQLRTGDPKASARASELYREGFLMRWPDDGRYRYATRRPVRGDDLPDPQARRTHG